MTVASPQKVRRLHVALNLIFDRTAADADTWYYLSTKLDAEGWSALTVEERVQWLSQLKGGYNHTDMNRVGSTTVYLGNRFTDLLQHLVTYRENYAVADDPLFHLPYVAEDVDINPKTNWSLGDPVWIDQATRYLADLSVLRGLLPLYAEAPAVPNDLAALSVQEANDIERLLYDIDAEITATTEKVEKWIRDTAAAWMYSGDIFSGEV